MHSCSIRRVSLQLPRRSTHDVFPFASSAASFSSAARNLEPSYMSPTFPTCDRADVNHKHKNKLGLRRQIPHPRLDLPLTTPFTSAVPSPSDDDSAEKHCRTCTCGHPIENEPSQQQHRHNDIHTENDHLPPPLPEPSYSVHKRILPSHLIALSSTLGKQLLLECLQDNPSSCYWPLMEQFTNQSDPAFCGVTTLLVVLNAMGVDPQIRWKGGWRFYANEDVLLQRCCLSTLRIQRVGITLEEFAQLAKCQGVHVSWKRPLPPTTEPLTPKPATQQSQHRHEYSLDDFRENVKRVLCQSSTGETNNDMLVVSFARSALGQTGEGHFSPLAAYHAETDRVLVLDVARFKYAPYWVTLTEMYNAMIPPDPTTNQSRGWCVLSSSSLTPHKGEARRPAHLVRQVGQDDICPIGKIKVHYCVASHQKPSATTT